MTLSIWVSNAMGANVLNLVEQSAVFKSRTTQRRPIVPATATDHIVYSGECKALMIQMTVLHGSLLLLGEALSTHPSRQVYDILILE